MNSGLEKIIAGYWSGLDGRKVALLTNHTAVDSWGRHAASLLGTVPGCEVVRLLAPEHGVWAIQQDMEAVPEGDTGRDPVFHIPVTSLYGDDEGSLTPSPACFEGVDALVYDIQDIGTRYYTYASSLAYVMDVAGDYGVPVWVLDRPNPLGPMREGPLLTPGFESFCGVQAGLPIRHGLTIGQLATWLHKERDSNTELHVVGCDARGRSNWIPTSPNMPTLETAWVYPGMCLLEGTTLSEGRGTTTPFLLVGAPGVDPNAVAAELTRREIPGVAFIPRMFRPEFGKHAHQSCGGVYIQIFDTSCIPTVPLGLHVLDAFARRAPNAFAWRTEPYEFVSDRPAIDLLWGSTQLRETIDAGDAIDPLIKESYAGPRAFVP